MGSIWKEIIIRKPFPKVYGNSTLNLPRVITYKKFYLSFQRWYFRGKLLKHFAYPLRLYFSENNEELYLTQSNIYDGAFLRK